MILEHLEIHSLMELGFDFGDIHISLDGGNQATVVDIYKDGKEYTESEIRDILDR